VVFARARVPSNRHEALSWKLRALETRTRRPTAQLRRQDGDAVGLPTPTDSPARGRWGKRRRTRAQYEPYEQDPVAHQTPIGVITHIIRPERIYKRPNPDGKEQNEQDQDRPSGYAEV
jgi:hypothetical protein